MIWNLYLAAVLFSPLEWPVTAQTFNCTSTHGNSLLSCLNLNNTLLKLMADVSPDSPVIFGSITIFGILTWWLTPEEKWLPAGRLGKLRALEEEAMPQTP